MRVACFWVIFAAFPHAAVASSDESKKFLRLSDNEAPRSLEAIVEANVKCIFRRVDLVYDENHSGPDHENLCELAGHAGERKILDLSQIPSNIRSTIQSGVDLLTFSTAELTLHDITIPSDATVTTEKIGGNLFGNRGNSKGRNLQGVDSKVLVVRISTTGSFESSPSVDAIELSDSIFGTSEDIVNLASQMNACSFGKQTFSPLTGFDLPSENASNVGVFEVEVTATSNSAADIANSVTTLLPFKFGTPYPFDHAMYCMPRGTDMAAIASGDDNGWLSTYNDETLELRSWATFPSIQMHEISHNKGLGHSGETNPDTGIFFDRGDLSGVMGTGFAWDDDTKTRMCFNGAKSWQLGWYADKATVVDPLATPSWTGTLVGIAEYDLADPNQGEMVLIKIETGNDVDYYINFNRMTGINSETQEGGDQVLITRQGGNGESNSQSELLAKLSASESFDIEDFANLGTVKVTVNSMNTASSPGVADITIARGTLTCSTANECPNSFDFSACSAFNCSSSRCEAEGCNCDNFCDTNEDARSCPMDCADDSLRFSLTTLYNAKTGGNAIMFNIKAMSHIQVLRFDINFQILFSLSTNAKVYTKVGSYQGSEYDDEAWSIVQDTPFPLRQGINKPTPLPALLNPVDIPKGTTQAFYIYLEYGLKYSVGRNLGPIPYTTDANMVISEGLGGSGLFFNSRKGPYSRVFNGNVDYVVVPLDVTEAPTASPSDLPSESPSSSPTVFNCNTDEECLQRDYADFLACTEFTTCNATSNTCVGGCNCDGTCDGGTENASNCPSDCATVLSFITTMDGTTGQQGNMFNIYTKTAVQITSFGIKVTGTGNYTAIVFMKAGSYVGFDGDSAAWTLVHTETVMGQGPGIFTELQRFTYPVALPANVTHAFYVMVTSGNLLYTGTYESSTPQGTVVADTDHLTLFSGLGKSVETKIQSIPEDYFGQTWPTNANPNYSRTWNGRVHYVVSNNPAPGQTLDLKTEPTPLPTPDPTPEPTPLPTPDPTPEPTPMPSPEPTPEPTPDPTPDPTVATTPEPAQTCVDFQERDICTNNDCDWDKKKEECKVPKGRRVLKERERKK